MLVLSRKIDQTICIGDNVMVTVVSIQGNKIRLGIEAPRDMEADRHEVREQKEIDAKLASQET